MKHEIYLTETNRNNLLTVFFTKKAALCLVLICFFVFTSKSQSATSTPSHEEDTTIVLAKEAFTVAFLHTPDNLLKFEIINNQFDSITPFFIETYVKGYYLNLSPLNIAQSVNNIGVITNIESVYGPQFMGFGLNALPPHANYKTTFKTEGTTNEIPSYVIRISGTINGKSVIWSNSYKN